MADIAYCIHIPPKIYSDDARLQSVKNVGFCYLFRNSFWSSAVCISLVCIM